VRDGETARRRRGKSKRETKICTRCTRAKGLAAFRRTARGGRRRWCIACYVALGIASDRSRRSSPSLDAPASTPDPVALCVPTSAGKSKLATTTDWLLDVLAHGPRDEPEVREAARRVGIRPSTLDRAKVCAGVESKRWGGLAWFGGWEWRLRAVQGAVEPDETRATDETRDGGLAHDDMDDLEGRERAHECDTDETLAMLALAEDETLALLAMPVKRDGKWIEKALAVTESRPTLDDVNRKTVDGLLALMSSKLSQRERLLVRALARLRTSHGIARRWATTIAEWWGTTPNAVWQMRHRIECKVGAGFG
jgi:hypothetical protein